jgi:hypothetical protein
VQDRSAPVEPVVAKPSLDAERWYDVAARVVHAGAGVRLGADAPAEAVAAAVRVVLGDGRHAAAAARLAAAIREETAADRAVAEVEGRSPSGGDAVGGGAQRGDVELLHLHHRVEGAL